MHASVLSLEPMNESPTEIPKTMKAIHQAVYGPAEGLEYRDVEVPMPGDDEVLIRVEAAGLDRGVWHLMVGKPYLVRIMGFGFRGPNGGRIGNDVSGVVVALGKDVTDFNLGDEVYGEGNGTFAQYVTANASSLAPKPAALTFEQAAALPASGVTAMHALEHGEAKSGQHVLIIGASGGVGTFAVQLAKAQGLTVTGVASTQKLEFVRSVGADHVIDYMTTDFTRSDQKYDLIVDIGGNRRLSALRRILTPTGTYVIVGGEEGGNLLGGIERNLKASFLGLFTKQKLRWFVSLPKRADFERFGKFVDDGNVAPVMDRSFPLEEAADAIRYMEDGHVRGKVVIVP